MIEVTAAQLDAWLAALMFPLARLLGLFSSAPVFSNRGVSVRVRLAIGMGVGFVFGLLMDVGLGAAMGQHALAYVVLAYLANSLARRVLWFPAWQQALHVLPLLLLSQVLMVLVRLLAGAEFPGWAYFLSSFSSALLWMQLSLLLLLPQLQPVERDDNRPI